MMFDDHLRWHGYHFLVSLEEEKHEKYCKIQMLRCCFGKIVNYK